MPPDPLVKRTRRRHWRDKFRHAFRGMVRGVHGHSSFFVHFFAAAVVIAAALVLEMSYLEWAVLLLCIIVVLAAEMFNSALESLARAVSSKTDPDVRDALDIASGAVLTASIGAVVVGLVVFLRRVAELLGWI